ncbi:hypothetical protein CWO91_41040 [Bradyrhizobium genosp. SA-3]|nr:hypothetical protein CWO91_41040 [Bradyrhizobium genosp. SA-3]
MSSLLVGRERRQWHSRIVSALQEQAKLNQIIFAGYTRFRRWGRGAALKLASPGLDHLFFFDSGLSSVEVALRMALGYTGIRLW